MTDIQTNYDKQRPLKVFTAFSGYDSQCLALDRLAAEHPGFGYELVGWSEIDRFAIQAHNALYPQWADRNYGDISKVDWESVPDFDLFTYSFPCGLKGTLIKTADEYKDISEVAEGDLVLTHANRYRRVVKTMTRKSPSYYRIKATGCDLRLTSEHPLYILRRGQEQWVKVSELETTDKLSFCIPADSQPCNLDSDTLWMLGRYCADGWVNPHHYHSVNFGIGAHKTEEFEAHIPEHLKERFRVYKKSAVECRIADESFQTLCLEFGSGAKNKHIPQWLIDSPKEQIDAFLGGYMAGDGHMRLRNGHPQWMFSTVSKQLFLGIQQLLMKSRGIVCSLFVRTDNRKDTFSDTYNGQFSSKSLRQEVRGDRIFVPVKKIQLVSEEVDVYNFEVEEDNSYTCDNVNVHNCQSISAAGLQHGFTEGSGTRSSLLWECRRAIEQKRPKFLLMENVKALTQKKFMPDFNKWIQCVTEYGYRSFWRVLNAKDYGVPQNRERVFMVSILDPDARYAFPEPFPLDKCLADCLEDEVDESYYLKQSQVDNIIAHCDRKQLEGCGFKPGLRDPDQTAGSGTSKGSGRETDNYVKETPTLDL